MPTNAHIREIGGESGGPQRAISSGPCNTPQQRQQQPDNRRSWSDLFNLGHHNTRITQAGDSHGS